MEPTAAAHVTLFYPHIEYSVAIISSLTTHGVWLWHWVDFDKRARSDSKFLIILSTSIWHAHTFLMALSMYRAWYLKFLWILKYARFSQYVLCQLERLDLPFGPVYTQLDRCRVTVIAFLLTGLRFAQTRQTSCLFLVHIVAFKGRYTWTYMPWKKWFVEIYCFMNAFKVNFLISHTSFNAFLSSLDLSYPSIGLWVIYEPFGFLLMP